MVQYPQDKRFGEKAWSEGFDDFHSSLRRDVNSMRVIKDREYIGIINTVKGNIDRKMYMEAFNMKAYGYIKYKIFDSILKSKYPIKKESNFKDVLLEVLNEFSLFLEKDHAPYLMVGKR